MIVSASFKLIFTSYIKEIIMTHTQLSQLVQALLDAPKSNPTGKRILPNLGSMQRAQKNKQSLQNSSYP